MSEKTYVPESLLSVLCSTPVSELRRTTEALVTTAPVGSRTTPFSEAVESWARAEVVDKTKTLIIHSRLRKCDRCTRESVMSPSDPSGDLQIKRYCSPVLKEAP